MTSRYPLRELARDVSRDIDAYLGFWSEYHAVRFTVAERATFRFNCYRGGANEGGNVRDIGK